MIEERNGEKLVSVIVISFNALEYLKKTIFSLVDNAGCPLELIVIDNGSTDGSSSWLEGLRGLDRGYLKGVKVRLNRENSGYSRACNQGLTLARGDYLAFLNCDLLFGPDWLKRLADHLISDPGAGLVGPMGVAVGGEQNYVHIYGEYVYRKPEVGGLERVNRRLYSNYRGSYTESKFLIGCCLLTHRRVVEEVGGFDPELFMSADDFDYSLRTRLAGYHLYAAEDVLIHHYDHRSFHFLEKGEEKKLIREGWQAFERKWARLLKDYTMEDLFYNQKKIFFGGRLKGRRALLRDRRRPREK